ncbi:ABC transporter permease [Motiliproteus sp. MSK22-1]|uniref:ABC transporter permease n=1 Tax=Motiliproteus sp. MSK22-1 TaxID=1897630 RepID=UPI000976AAB1|nr:ABC transporter permease [Motiliproteus sp. MSK22-1]OMH28452.1 sugar ABC transporter permease [Motiliproteus sp. MSK22-1]
MIRMLPRPEASLIMVYLSPLLALLLTLMSGFIMFTMMGIDGLLALEAFFISPVGDLYGFSELLVKAIPLVLIGIGLSIGFKANVWNIGAEGQLTMGAIFSGALAIFAYEVEGGWVLPAMALAGVLGGMLWAAIPALLKTRYNANEILTSLMLTYVALLFLSYLVNGPLRDPEGFNFPESRMFGDSGLLPVLLEDTRLHIGLLAAIAVAIAAWVMLSRTLIGFQVKVVGAAPRAAEFAGFREKALIWFCLLLAGGLSGLAGMIEVSGPIGQLVPQVSPGYGFTAIIVAFVGRLHPLGVCIAGMLLALSYLGGENLQIEMGLPQAVTGVFQGMLLFFLLACDVLIKYRFVFGSGKVQGAA